MPTSDEHLRWLVRNRSRNQAVTYELYSLIRTSGTQLGYDFSLQLVSQELAAAAFSLWRAVFLSDLSGNAETRMLHAEAFLRKLIADNTVVYQADKDSREWTYSYYVDNARYRLIGIGERLMPELLAVEHLRANKTTERDAWETTQAALEEAIANFGRALAQPRLPETRPLMKALLSKSPGGPDTLVLDDLPEPAPGKGEIRLAVHACGVNFPDSLIIEDRYQFKPPRPFAPGGEVAGIVDAVGEGVDAALVGKKMIGFIGHGGMAEKVVLDLRRAAPMPDGMPFETAAAFIMTYGTSIHALKDRAKLQAGETLLVLGAAGGVGLSAVELGKAYGARVVAAASSQAKLDLALAHGADAGVVYPTGPFDRDGQKALARTFKDALGEAGADVVYDSVGGDYSEAALRAIGWEGRFLVIGFPAGIARLPLNLTLLKSCQVVGVFWGAFAQRDPKRSTTNNAELMRLYAEGKIKPEVSATYPLARGGDAIAALAGRRASGKLVVTMA